ncbi:MAG: AAA family ATPase, partial [Bacteroidales bacterium]|nr:AAA family ATPase [Bacteroidales bacterium]
RKLKDAGITSEDELEEFKAWKRQKETAQERKRSQIPSISNSFNNSESNPFAGISSSGTTTVEPSELSIDEKLAEKWEKKSKERVSRPRAAMTQHNMTDFIQKPVSSSAGTSNQPFFDDQSVSVDFGNEQKSITNADRRIKARKTEAQETAEKAEEQTQILELLKETKQYTFKWYKLLMELMHSDKQNALNRHIQLDFSEWEFTCSDKILHLFSPSAIVPKWLAEATNVVVSTLSEKPTPILGAIAKADESSVDISIEMTDELRNGCRKAKKIRLVADNPSNIVDSLETRFLQLGFEDDFDMNENLTTNIEFIYGPTGTGKTTKLVEMVSDIVSNTENVNILVLTPTNKASDVVAIKMTNDEECFNYLTRFGSTESLYLIEDAAVVSNRDTTNMKALPKNIVVTTAARYAYDCVQPDDTFICDFPWDYIFIDEASMIDILTVTYILYKGATSKIVISGDPMQIEPVEQNNMPAYNVYDLVGLHGFKDAIQNYKRYPVIGLTVQHRSVPNIGSGVSKYAYNGLVAAENRAPQKPLNLDGVNIRNINFLGYDIAEFDLVTGLTSIGDSAFQLYAAIFTYNMAEYIVNQISKKYSDSTYSIGIVCPYRAEADAIKQMLESRPIDTKQCKVICGTVHSFQGDECDIMFVVLNPPAQCTTGTHINKKNIINVAMSRARDYLFFVLPNGQQKGFTLKNDLDRVFNMTQKQVLNCSKIEETIFGSSNYIADHTHVTCHMPVNVYCENTAIYEVRMRDDALDIKINSPN